MKRHQAETIDTMIYKILELIKLYGQSSRIESQFPEECQDREIAFAFDNWNFELLSIGFNSIVAKDKLNSRE